LGKEESRFITGLRNDIIILCNLQQILTMKNAWNWIINLNTGYNIGYTIGYITAYFSKPIAAIAFLYLFYERVFTKK
jgi:hypothetical protein